MSLKIHSLALSALLTSAFAAISVPAVAHADGLSADEPCVAAAIAQTYQAFPLHQKMTTRFFEWGSSTDSAWSDFKNNENNGYEGHAAYVSQEEVQGEINTNYFSPQDAPRKAQLTAEIQGKKLLTLDFSFSEGDLGRYFMVLDNDGTTCHVKHIATKIDDFDNG